MPLTYMSQKVKPNVTQPFNFPATVTAYLAGIASFNFTYGNDDHHVEEISLSLNANQSGPQQVSVSVTGILNDADGNGIDNNNSYVTVVVLAWTGSSTSNTILAGPQTDGNGQQGQPFYLPGTNPNILQSSLSGFFLDYDEDHHIEGANVAMGVSSNGNQANLTATAKMWDADGNTAVSPTSTGNLLASVDPNPGFVVTTWTAQDAGQQTIPMGTSVKDAVTLMTSFKVQFADDHHLRAIGAGPDSTKVDSTNSSQVITSGVWSWMSDDNNNNQDNAKSNCSVIVIGLL